jgi:beta-lactamase regulating signal transducer with metallopeptidase domain
LTLELALRSTAILAAAWGLMQLMPRATAATRHLVWHVALFATLLAPLAAVMPLPQIPIVPSVPTVKRVLDVMQAGDGTRPNGHAPLPVPGDRSAAASSASAADMPSLWSPPTVRMLFLIGSTAVAFWFAAGWLTAWMVTRRAQRAPGVWQLEANALCERLRVGREVRVLVIDEHVSPLATGLVRASVLLPATAAAWTADRRRAVLLHELAHIKRRDCRVQLVAQAACVLYWFNPLVWMAAAALRRARERACDDEVLRWGAQASNYAAHLLDIAREMRPSLRPSAALAMARPSELEGRLLSVLAAGRARVPLRGTRWVVVSVLSMTTAAALAATSITTVPATAPAATGEAPRYVVTEDVTASSYPPPTPRAQSEATLDTSADPQDRERATLALAFTSGKDVIPALLKALEDPDSQVREKAAIGLALRRDARVVEPLIKAMADSDSQVREKVAIALGTSGDQRAQDALKRALADPDAQVREKAAAGLILFGLTP